MAEKRTETDKRGISHPTFVDRDGRKWTIALDFEVYRRVLTGCEVDLCDIVYPEQKCLRKLSDAITLVDVVWEIVQEQAIREGVREEQFAKAIDMSILQDVQRKLIDEMLFFSRSHPRAPIVMEAVAAAEKAEAMAKEEVERAMPEIRKQMRGFALGGSDGGSPGSSASTLADGPSVSLPGRRSSGSGKAGTTRRRSSPKQRK
jgi:hypothetical protein